MNDPIGDMLTRIRNAGMRGKSTVMVPASKMRVRVLEVLAGEGYIRGFEVERHVGFPGTRTLDRMRDRAMSRGGVREDAPSPLLGERP